MKKNKARKIAIVLALLLGMATVQQETKAKPLQRCEPQMLFFRGLFSDPDGVNHHPLWVCDLERRQPAVPAARLPSDPTPYFVVRVPWMRKLSFVVVTREPLEPANPLGDYRIQMPLPCAQPTHFRSSGFSAGCSPEMWVDPHREGGQRVLTTVVSVIKTAARRATTASARVTLNYPPELEGGAPRTFSFVLGLLSPGSFLIRLPFGV
jgi:hypothetical protein